MLVARAGVTALAVAELAVELLAELKELAPDRVEGILVIRGKFNVTNY